ncbi:MAG: DUF2948 family protein [Rhizobiaceae bacterium]|jgi:hypothetical protein|nr:DUF2948 family protein [Rhizobiaceae bacterium]
MSDPQRLAAFDADDLNVISTLVQDAVCQVGDIHFAAARALFSLTLNRFKWDDDRRSRTGARVRSVLHFARVSGVKSSGINQSDRQAVLSLLALRFEPGEAPSGIVELVFSGGATLRLNVECIEAALADTDAEWAAIARPSHKA